MNREVGNVLNMTYPFKGSFKGKGQILKTVKELSNQFKQIRQEMEALVQNYNDVFIGATHNNPGLVNLRIAQRSVHPMMRWRHTGISGNFFELFDSEAGELILAKAGPKTIATLIEFEKKRLVLNARLSIVVSMIKSYNRYLKKMQRLEGYEQ